MRKKKVFLILVFAFISFFSAQPATAGVSLVTLSSEKEPSQEFQEFFGILQFKWQKLQRQTNFPLFDHEFAVAEHRVKGGKWLILIHPLVGAKHLDAIVSKEELSGFVWRVEREKLKNRVQRRKKAEEAAKWLFKKIKAIEKKYLDEVDERLKKDSQKFPSI